MGGPAAYRVRLLDLKLRAQNLPSNNFYKSPILSQLSRAETAINKGQLMSKDTQINSFLDATIEMNGAERLLTQAGSSTSSLAASGIPPPPRRCIFGKCARL
jgi:hypothetical protein